VIVKIKLPVSPKACVSERLTLPFPRAIENSQFIRLYRVAEENIEALWLLD
jgi:hypothetical protein